MKKVFSSCMALLLSATICYAATNVAMLPDQPSQECIDYAYAAADAEMEFYESDSSWLWSELVNEYAWDCELNEDEGIVSLDPVFL